MDSIAVGNKDVIPASRKGARMTMPDHLQSGCPTLDSPIYMAVEAHDWWRSRAMGLNWRERITPR
jgi:hypothetical protein